MPDNRTERLNAVLEGRYHIERELGAGGMATVYLAEDGWPLAPELGHRTDGRFLMMRPVQTKRIDVRVALNWIADVRARLERAK
jgi:hypothetical protein